MDRNVLLGGIFAVLVGLSKLTGDIMTPLYLDSLNPIYTNYTDINNMSIVPVPVVPDAIPTWQIIDPFFAIVVSMGFDTTLFACIVLFLYLCVPGKITEREMNYPKFGLFLSGSAQALAAMLNQFSSSGTRTAPYLQGVLRYSHMPITFVLRYIILHKRPTRRKFICALVVFIGEFICLLPSIIPGMESARAKKIDGGAQGIAGMLWPIAFMSANIPHAVWSILLEKGSKDKAGAGAGTPLLRLNMAYVMFWNFLGTITTTLLLFWLDLIPGFGLLQNIHDFFPQFAFNMKCIFGAADVCGFHQVFTAWSRMIAKTTMFVSVGCLVRYSEGANFYAIVTAVITPLLFLAFTLIDEQTARWHPHATLSTWLSLGALVIMIPAVVIYNFSEEANTSEESSRSPNTMSDGDEEENDEQTPLLRDVNVLGTSNSINTTTET